MTSEPQPASLKKGTTPGCAQIGKTFFRKTRLPKFGTSKPRFRRILAPNRAFCCQKIFAHFYFQMLREHIWCHDIGAEKVPQITQRASNFPKSLSSISFLDIDSCPFSQEFFESCAKSNRNITKLFYVIIVKKREHNGHRKKWMIKSHFWAPKKT